MKIDTASLLPQTAIFSQNIGTEDDPQWVIGMKVWTAATEYTFLVADAENYVQVARAVHDAIMKAGRDCRTGNTGLVVVKDLPDALKNGRPEGRQ